MKTKLFVIFALVLGMGLPTLASATYLPSLDGTADCSGWEATAFVYFGTLDLEAVLNYEVVLLEDGATEGITQSGQFIPPFTKWSTVPFSFSGTWADLCGTYTVTGTFTLVLNNGHTEVLSFTTETFTCECDEEYGCFLTPGYWKNHKKDPAWDTYFTIGGSPYSYGGMDDLIAILKMNVGTGDASIILAHHLIAAKLNVIAGNTGIMELDDAIAEGDAIIAQFGVALGALVNENYPVERAAALDIKDILASYNELGCPDEDDEMDDEVFQDKSLDSQPEQSTWGSLKSMYK